MNNKHVIFFLLFVLVAPVLGSFYLSLEKERNGKKVVLSAIPEEEETENKEKSSEKECEKWKKGKYHFINQDIAFQLQNKISIEYYHFSSKVLFPFSESITPPPKIS